MNWTWEIYVEAYSSQKSVTLISLGGGPIFEAYDDAFADMRRGLDEVPTKHIDSEIYMRVYQIA